MAANAYVLINVEPARTQQVLDRLRGIHGALVREVLGPYDIIVELEGDTTEDLTHTVRARIRPVQGITNTITCMWVS